MSLKSDLLELGFSLYILAECLQHIPTVHTHMNNAIKSSHYFLSIRRYTISFNNSFKQTFSDKSYLNCANVFIPLWTSDLYTCYLANSEDPGEMPQNAKCITVPLGTVGLGAIGFMSIRNKSGCTLVNSNFCSADTWS